jgi:hypothetical protein
METATLEWRAGRIVILGSRGDVESWHKPGYEEHGVLFNLKDTPTAIDDRKVTLKNGGKLDADLVAAGVGGPTAACAPMEPISGRACRIWGMVRLFP